MCFFLLMGVGGEEEGTLKVKYRAINNPVLGGGGSKVWQAALGHLARVASVLVGHKLAISMPEAAICSV